MASPRFLPPRGVRDNREIASPTLTLSTASASPSQRVVIKKLMMRSSRPRDRESLSFINLPITPVLALLSSLRRISERNSAEVERLVRNYFDFNLESRLLSSRSGMFIAPGRCPRANSSSGRRNPASPPRSRRISSLRVTGSSESRLCARRRFSPTAVGHTVCCPTKLWLPCVGLASRPAGWRTVYRSGGRQGCRW